MRLKYYDDHAIKVCSELLLANELDRPSFTDSETMARILRTQIRAGLLQSEEIFRRTRAEE